MGGGGEGGRGGKGWGGGGERDDEETTEQLPCMPATGAGDSSVVERRIPDEDKHGPAVNCKGCVAHATSQTLCS